MPVTIQSTPLNFKDSNGQYIGINAVTERTTAEQVADISSAGATQITAIQNKGTQTLASIPEDYTSLNNVVNNYILVQDSQPSNTANKFWVDSDSTEEYSIPTYEEHETLKSALINLPSTETLSDITWSQGYIRDNGTEGTASNICRSSAFLQYPGGVYVRFQIASGFKIRLYEYSSNSTSNFVKIVNGYTETEYLLLVVPGHYYRINIMKTNESALAPSGISTSAVVSTLLETVGKSIDDNNMALYRDVLFPVSRSSMKECPILSSDIVNGGFGTTGSELTDATNRLRLKWFIRVTDANVLYFKPGTVCTNMYIVFYDSKLQYKSYSTFSTEQTIYSLVTSTTENEGYIMVVLRNSGSTTISTGQFDATVTLKTMNAIKYDVQFEKGKFGTGGDRYDGPVATSKEYIRNKYPISIGSNTKKIVFPSVTSSSEQFTVYFRASDGSAISTSNLTASVVHNVFVNIPDTTRYVDICITTTGLYDVPIVIVTADEEIKATKRVFINSTDQMRDYFMVDYHRDLYSSMCYMMPPNYSPTGKKVPLVLYFGGNDNYPTMGSYFPEGKVPGLQYVRDEGFAVVQIYSWGSYYANKYPACGKDQPYPVATCIECIKKGLEYITDRYNVDPDNVHIMSKSMGGIISLYFASRPVWNFKTIGMFCPALDLFCLRGRFLDGRKALMEELQLVSEDFLDFDRETDPTDPDSNFYYSQRCCENTWANNLGKLIQINPAWLNLVGATFDQNYTSSVLDARAWYVNKANPDIYGETDLNKIAKIPVKIWGVKDDPDVPYLSMTETIAQLRNAGVRADMRSANTGGHQAFDISTTYAVSGTTALGITYTDIPCGWVENVEWIRENSMHTTDGTE